MLHAKETVRPLLVAAVLIGLAGCANGDGYDVECGADYCSWFVDAQLVAVTDLNPPEDLAITDPWPGP